MAIYPVRTRIASRKSEVGGKQLAQTCVGAGNLFDFSNPENLIICLLLQRDRIDPVNFWHEFWRPIERAISRVNQYNGRGCMAKNLRKRICARIRAPFD